MAGGVVRGTGFWCSLEPSPHFLANLYGQNMPLAGQMKSEDPQIQPAPCPHTAHNTHKPVWSLMRGGKRGQAGTTRSCWAEQAWRRADVFTARKKKSGYHIKTNDV